MKKEVCVNSLDAGRSQVELEKNVCFKWVQIRDLCNLCMLWDAVCCTGVSSQPCRTCLESKAGNLCTSYEHGFF